MSGMGDESSVVVVGSVEDWSVRLVSGQGSRPAAVPSHIVLRMVEGVERLVALGAAPDYVLGVVEEALKEAWAKSVALASAVEGAGPGAGEWVEMADVVRLSGVDWADLPLLFSIAGLHSHALMQSLSL